MPVLRISAPVQREIKFCFVWNGCIYPACSLSRNEPHLIRGHFVSTGAGPRPVSAKRDPQAIEDGILMPSGHLETTQRVHCGIILVSLFVRLDMGLPQIPRRRGLALCPQRSLSEQSQRPSHAFVAATDKPPSRRRPHAKIGRSTPRRPGQTP